MDERNKIIVSEIKKWQENKLLPHTYCQFLLSLYTEGEHEESKDKTKLSISLVTHFKKGLVIFFTMVLFLFSFIFVISFTQFSASVQLLFLILLLILSVLGARYYAPRNPSFLHLYIIFAAFISFIITITGVALFFEDEKISLGIGIAILCSTWVAIGWRFRYHYLYIAGGTGILLLIALILMERM